jgi:hypothetical protein
MDWTQLILLQAVGTVVLGVAYLWAHGRQAITWPSQRLGFVRFLLYRLRHGFALTVEWTHLRKELVYGALLAFWLVTAAHWLAGIVAGCPLAGGPSYFDFVKPFGLTDFRKAQAVASVVIVGAAFVLAHVPMYGAYVTGRGNDRTRRQGKRPQILPGTAC